MVTDVFAATGAVVTVKVAVVVFAATVTLVETVAAAVLQLDNVTTAPPDGAGALSVMVPTELVPPRTEVGFKKTVFRVGEFTVRIEVCVTLP